MCSSTSTQSCPHRRMTWGPSTKLMSVTVMEGKSSPLQHSREAQPAQHSQIGVNTQQRCLLLF